MNYDRVYSLLTKASEAIITADGKVKQRLNSFETVVNQKQDDPYYVPEGAVNDNYGNLDYLADKIRSRGINSRLSHLRYTMYGAFALVIIGFLWSTYQFLSPTISSTDSENQSVGNPDNELAAQVHETQLERIANLVLTDNDWSDTRISVFMKHWDPSSSEAREKYKSTAWFQQFSFRLENKFNRAIYTGELFANGSNGKRLPLYILALAVGVADPKVDYAKKADERSVYSKLENEVTSELVKVDKSKVQQEKENNGVAADEIALAKILKNLQGKPLLPSDTATKETNNSSEPKTKIIKKAAEPSVVAAAPPSISEDDVSRVLQKYSAAYEKGDLKEMSSLFGVNDPGQGQRIIEQLKSNYGNVFANSQKRTVNFNGLNWRFDGKEATVDSDYRAQIKLNENKGTQTITANARLNLIKDNNDLKIANFELLNRSVSVTTPELNIISAHSPKALPEVPTAAELQDIVTRLVSSYESGDLNTFTSLFAKNAKTNDRQNLDGIKRDYSQLFKDSSDRQMFIQGMQWTFDNNFAKGIGSLEAIILSKNDNSVYSLGGKIQLVAQRIDGKVRITHMYHIEREK